MKLYIFFKQGGGLGYIGNSLWMRRLIRKRFKEALRSPNVSKILKSNIWGKLKEYKPNLKNN